MSEAQYEPARKRMVDEQIRARSIHEPRLLATMGHVPRHHFVLPDDLAYAYADGPLPIGFGQTISQPFIVAYMTELLSPQPDERVLEVGTGSGYQAAVLGELAQEVYTIETIPELVERAGRTLTQLGYANVHVHLGDGSLGWVEAAPYDGILVAAFAPEVPPPLLEQLADGGRLVAPVGNRGYQQLQVWKKNGDQLTMQKDIAVAFVPLRGEHGWN